MTVYPTTVFINHYNPYNDGIYAWHKNCGSWWSKEGEGRGLLYKFALRHGLMNLYNNLEKIIDVIYNKT
jgi:hypothetical protein